VDDFARPGSPRCDHPPRDNPIYHPTLVGDDFFLQSGAAVSINLAPPTGR
jgi:hypothetical protein